MIANHLWQSTAFALVAGLLTLAFRKHRAAVRCALWFAASLKFLIPFSLFVMAAGRLAPSVPPSASPLSWAPAIHRLTEPFPQTQLQPVIPTPRRSPIRLRDVLLAVWLCGVAANLFVWWRQWRRMRAAVRTATPVHFDTPIPVVSARTDLEPGVFGIWRPVLLLPESIAARLTPSQLEAILIHELCHVRRRDNLAASVHMLVESLFWFHPLVWWVGLRLVAERERACDEEVLRQIGDPESYAEGILSVCKFYAESPACVAGVTGANLKKRIEAIMIGHAGKRLQLGGKLLLAVALLAAAAVPFLMSMASPTRLHAQSDSAQPAAFDAVSIKKNDDPGWRGMSFDTQPGGRFHAKNVPLQIVISIAYDLPFQGPRLSGGPDWIRGDKYDIDATPPPGSIQPGIGGKALDARVRPMLRAMLADRFKLVIRRETKDLPVYAITVGKNGPKLKPADVQEADCSSQPGSGVVCHSFHGGMGRGMQGLAVDLDDVALFVGNWTDRPVINRTGLTGLFAIDTEGWAPMTPRQPRTDGSPDPEGERMADPSRPTIFMIFNRLGLNLESSKGPAEMYTIESVERPAAN
jgi:bla regulator protein blaR1